MAELTERLAERGFGGRAPTGSACWVDLVRVPPSGTWERRRADLYGLADDVARPPPDGLTEDAAIERWSGATSAPSGRRR